MLKFAWRWSQIGDAVFVHDRNDIERDLMPGVIAAVDRDRSDVSIGVKVDDGDGPRWVWMTPLFMHPRPLDSEESCWICDQNDARKKEAAR